MADDRSTLQRKNLSIFFKHGPGLRKDYNIWIEGKDQNGKYVLLAGLGGLGVGRMWVPFEGHHADYPGYEDAPVIPWTEEQYREAEAPEEPFRL